MKARFLMMAVFLLASHMASATGTEMDITLEGPWILYPSQINTKDANDKVVQVNVLVAAAPGINSGGNRLFHKPMVSAGDGYVIPQEGLYCLMFETVCAKDTTGKFVPDTGYFPPTLLSVAFPNGKGWDPYLVANQTSQTKPKAFVLILPMPDTYSNDGMWNMRFSADYSSYSSGQPFTIGVRLHYNTGPAFLDLSDCNKFDATHCLNPVDTGARHHTKLTNTGLIRIVMKVPQADEEDDPACDFHVRSIYHPMLYLIDDTLFATRNNQNQAIGFVDPSTGFDDKSGNPYYDPTCLDPTKDGEGNDAPPKGAPTRGKLQKKRLHAAMQAEASTRTFVTTFNDTLAEAKQLLGADSKILQEISADGKFINSKHETPGTQDDFPMLSQLDRLASELHKAAKEVQATNKEGSSENARKLNRVADDVDGSKNGADCRAPIMMLPQS